MIDQRLTDAIAVPKQYKIDLFDGRSLLLASWNPVLQVGDVVKLNASFIVLDRDGNDIPVLGDDVPSPKTTILPIEALQQRLEALQESMKTVVNVALDTEYRHRIAEVQFLLDTMK